MTGFMQLIDDLAKVKEERDALKIRVQRLTGHNESLKRRLEAVKAAVE